eukprot:scaffold96187_cov56-Phaeocystis_antarctica.AAC.4
MSVTLEVSKLSDWLNGDANCRESKGGHMVRDDVRPGRREAAGDRGARSVQWRARLQIGGRARGGAHEEHVVHVRDVGGVEAQRLVERQRVLPRVERRECGAVRGVRVGRREAASDHGARSMPERDRLKIEGRARGRSARRTSGVETRRLVERRRFLPRVERRACGAGRGGVRVGRREAAGNRGAPRMQERDRL